MKRDVRLAKALLAAVMVSVSAGTGWQLWVSREQTLAAADTNNLNLANALNIYAEGIFTQSDMLLQGVAETLKAEGNAREHMQRVQSLVERQKRLLDPLDGVAVLDARGNWLIYSKGEVPRGTNSAKRPYFIAHRDTHSNDDHISPPVRNPFSANGGSRSAAASRTRRASSQVWSSSAWACRTSCAHSAPSPSPTPAPSA